MKNRSIDWHLDLFHFLIGKWTLRRTIADAAQVCVAHANGQAEFSAGTEAGVLTYIERGQLMFVSPVNAGASAISFSRQFRYLLEPDRVTVFFADGPDHGKRYQTYRWCPTSQMLTPLAPHACSADRYSSEYRMQDAAHFDMDTTILGPLKNHALHTSFTRSGDADESKLI